MRAERQRTVQVLGTIFFFAAVSVAQAEPCKKSVGRLVSLQGTVEARPSNQTVWQAAKLNDKFCPGDAIRTGARSRAAMVLANETIVRLDQFTTLTLTGLDDKSTSWIDLLSGMAHFLSRTPRSLKVKTPYINAGVEGTEFVVRADPREGSVSVLEGRVLAENDQGNATLVSGESAAAAPGQAPVKRLVVQIRDAMQWSLYYPPLFEGRALTGSESWAEAARRSAAAYLAGDSAAAFAAIASVPNSVTDARFFNYRAGLLLSVGRVDEAQADISRSLQQSTDNAHALALQSVLALARGDSSTALDLARKANTRDPASVSAWVALSYAQQAAFDLDAARASMQQAVHNDPNNALAWARLAELWLALGDLEKAQDTADRAVSINANIARTQTVRGFASLTRIKIANAQRAFEMAISQDSADPLARLGLGLALIRQGHLAAGRREIEIAAALDPNNALVRSYLGKAYYEEKRNPLATAQLDMAKLLDPQDPTPWFYDAIRKQAENRPVEALSDLQRSIGLNENRALYRSRFLLDQDLAMRGASLARIYRDIGMGPVAEGEAVRSIALDPTNHSAHRFLSDSYIGRPRHEIARASEQLQSQLLQPVGMSPIQAQAAETNLSLATSPATKEVAYNEFAPLFERNDSQVMASALAGSNNTFADELTVAGLQDRFSYSLGQFYYETDGFRESNDVEHRIYSAFAQLQVTQKLDLQIELRRRETEQGDLRLVSDPNFVPTDRRALNQDVARFGLHYRISPHSDVIASLVRSSSEETFSRVEPTETTIGSSDMQGHDGELQYLFHAPVLSGIIGAGMYDVENDESLVLNVPFPPFAIPLADGVFQTKQRNGYLYFNVPIGRRLMSTIGVSYDSLRNDQLNLDIGEVNPKLGLQWDIMQGLRLRTAAFETTKRALLINQTIEPTQVAGFNQFFDDIDGTRARTLGVALETASQSHHSGVEMRRRRLEVPNVVSGGNIIEKRGEDYYRAYVYWTPYPRWSYSADFEFEMMRGEYTTPDPAKLDTLSIPLGVRYFHPNGVYGGMIATYVRQEVGFIGSSTFQTMKEDFSIVDLVMGYRLPRRIGTLSLEVKNLFKRHFLYQDYSFMTADQFNFNPRYIPDRLIFLKAALKF